MWYNNSIKIVLDTLEPAMIDIKETSNKESQKSRLLPTKVFAAKRATSHEIPSELLKIPDMKKQAPRVFLIW